MNFIYLCCFCHNNSHICDVSSTRVTNSTKSKKQVIVVAMIFMNQSILSTILSLSSGK